MGKWVLIVWLVSARLVSSKCVCRDVDSVWPDEKVGEKKFKTRIEFELIENPPAIANILHPGQLLDQLTAFVHKVS